MSEPVTPRQHYTVAEYLESERLAEQRHEYRDGRIVAMAGGSFNHAQIISNVLALTKLGVRPHGCDAYASDLKVSVRSANDMFYPDIIVLCGGPEFDPVAPGEAVTNPSLIIEVLSPSTGDYDRTEKFWSYLLLESLREYVLIASDRLHVESLLRQSDGTWSLRFTEGRETVAVLRSFGVQLPMADIYAGSTVE